MQVKPDAGRQKSCAIFEANNSVKFTLSISSPRREVGLLKDLWDMITMVQSSIAAWTTTLWREIQVEDMDLECKRFSKDIRGLDKEVSGENGQDQEI